jgi:hypothetical protein
MKKSTKKPQSSTVVTETTKKQSFTDFHDFGQWRVIPFSDSRIEERGREIVRLAQDEEGGHLILSEIYDEMGMCDDTIHNWRHKNSYFDSCIKYAKRILANRRYRGALTGELNRDAAKGPFGHYNHPELISEWKDSHNFLSSLKVDEASKGVGGPVTVNMVTAPDTDVVPKKKDKSE